ncbi:maleate cis-trans isomerase family protein [Tropicimonas sediminicola]|uniref:Maleate isomerase n=1 Tax=Tropicimonas sediminicola TaxID=1031541 RepID=A0A239CB47_9RHOB|nr:aspartate/glutamate racemase family protein [Tropicimonas sediminicola]SNS17447.1 maleate isomerase [Tropicimonas sediminicola]
MMGCNVMRAGLIVPSSNTVVEDVWSSLAPARPDLRCHFTRLSVTRIDQSNATDAQFERDRLLRAAALLAELEPDRLVWAGTAAAWLGFERDRALCDLIEAETGIPATTSLLAINAALAELGAKQIGLLTPYTAETEAAIVANYAAAGIEVAAKRRLDLEVNRDFGTIPPERLRDLAEELAAQGVDAIAIICTNLLGAPLVTESGLIGGAPVVDSVMVTFDALGRAAPRPA